jgi:hypothetical protein
MPKNPLPPRCPKCREFMHFVIVKTGGRKFRCFDCDNVDPLAAFGYPSMDHRSELLPPKTQ